MVDAIGSSSTDWTRALDDDDDEVRRRAASAATAKVATAPPEILAPPDTNGALLIRAAQNAQTVRPLLAMGVDAAAVRMPDQDTAVQGRMDAFFAKAVPTYRIPPEGPGQVEKLVTVATPFQMATKTTVPPGVTPDATTRRFLDHEASVVRNAPELMAVAVKAGIRPETLGPIMAGRGTAGQIQTLTQALLDQRKLPPAEQGETIDVRVRRMMSSYGIGLDCAGYTQQALLAAHGITRAQAGLDPKIMNEDLSHLLPARFAPVAPGDARAGDIIALGPKDPGSSDVGHRVIVSDCHAASPQELERFCRSGQGAALARGRVSVLVVDSSFGASAIPSKGGVLRQTWLYDSVGKQWGMVIPASTVGQTVVPEHVNVRPEPLDSFHRLLGVYHYQGAR